MPPQLVVAQVEHFQMHELAELNGRLVKVALMRCDGRERKKRHRNKNNGNRKKSGLKREVMTQFDGNLDLLLYTRSGISLIALHSSFSCQQVFELLLTLA